MMAARNADVCEGVCSVCMKPVAGVVVASNASAPMIDGRLGASVGDICLAACGHAGNIVAGSPKLMYGAKPAARAGDVFAGVYAGVIMSGSPTQMID